MKRSDQEKKKPLKPNPDSDSNSVDYNRLTIFAWRLPKGWKRPSSDAPKSEQKKDSED
ncbi:MAG: hypothetical protein WHX93_02300 [bacterium]